MADVLTFYASDTENGRSLKLNKLRAMLSGANAPLNISVVDLPLADGSVPLLRVRLTKGYTFTTNQADAGIAATGATALRLRKDGIANGTISFSGTVGTVSFVDPIYPANALFELYPPVSPDPTLDRVSITLGS